MKRKGKTLLGMVEEKATLDMRKSSGRDVRKFQSEQTLRPWEKRGEGRSRRPRCLRSKKGTSIAKMAEFYMNSDWGKSRRRARCGSQGHLATGLGFKN